MLAGLLLLVGITTGSWSPKEAEPPLACLDSGACYQVCLGSAEKRRMDDNVLCKVVLIMALLLSMSIIGSLGGVQHGKRIRLLSRCPLK